MDDHDLMYSNVATTGFPSGPIDIAQLAETMRRFQAKDDVRKSRAYFDVLQIESCRVCGEKIEYKEHPREHYAMCGHMLAELKRQFESRSPSPMGVPLFPDLMGMPICIKAPR